MEPKIGYIAYGHFSHVVRIDTLHKYPGYNQANIRVNQSVDGDGVWGKCEISNTGFGQLTVEQAELFLTGWPIAIEIAKRWNEQRAGKHGSECPLDAESEVMP